MKAIHALKGRHLLFSSECPRLYIIGLPFSFTPDTGWKPRLVETVLSWCALSLTHPL